MPDVSTSGAAYLAGLKAGVYKNLDHLSQLNAGKKIFQPSRDNKIKTWYNEWKTTVSNSRI